jgi:hypothetical protein
MVDQGKNEMKLTAVVVFFGFALGLAMATPILAAAPVTGPVMKTLGEVTGTMLGSIW